MITSGTGGGLAGQLSGSVNLGSALPAGITLSGTFGLAINETQQAVAESLTVGGTAVSINLPAGPYVSISATNAKLTVLGQVLSGSFSIQRITDANNVTTTDIVASDVSLSLGTGASTFVSVTGGSGTLELTGGGVAGTLSGTVTTAVPGVSISGTFTVTLNTTSQAVTLPVLVSGQPRRSPSTPARSSPSSPRAQTSRCSASR